MSRSRRKHPWIGVCSGSEKLSKRIWNRFFRRSSKNQLHNDPEGALPLNIHKETELWDGAKDGKRRIDLTDTRDRRLMRK